MTEAEFVRLTAIFGFTLIGAYLAHVLFKKLRRPRCPHGAEMNREWPPGCAVAAPVSTCTCCNTCFMYIEHVLIDENGIETGSVWSDYDRCADCGGKYVQLKPVDDRTYNRG